MPDKKCMTSQSITTHNKTYLPKFGPMMNFWKTITIMPAGRLIALLLISGLSACQPANNNTELSAGPLPSNDLSSFAPTDGQRTEILATVQGIFDALAGDADQLSEIMMPDVIMRSNSVEEDGSVTSSTSTVNGLRSRIVSGGAIMVERMFDSKVMVSGPIATVWTPYDFYTGGEFSHCGIDVVTLTQTQKGWRIISLDWTRQQPPDCQLHPDGPPTDS